MDTAIGTAQVSCELDETLTELKRLVVVRVLERRGLRLKRDVLNRIDVLTAFDEFRASELDPVNLEPGSWAEKLLQIAVRVLDRRQIKPWTRGVRARLVRRLRQKRRRYLAK